MDHGLGISMGKNVPIVGANAGACAMAESKKSIVQSVGKAFRLLEAFRSDDRGQVLADLARAADLDNGTTFRLLNTLVMLGYVEKVSGTRTFRLTLKCLDLGFNAIARADLRALARPLLREVVGPNVEAASVGVLDGNEVVYVERIQAGLVRLAVDIRIGSRIPAHSSALGLAILSRMPEAQQRKILGQTKLRKLTANTQTDPEKLIKRLKAVKTAGFVISDGETVSGLRVIAAPIVDVDGLPIAGVSAAAPAFKRTCEEFEREAKGPILSAAKKLSKAIQAAGGTAQADQSPRND